MGVGSRIIRYKELGQQCPPKEEGYWLTCTNICILALNLDMTISLYAILISKLIIFFIYAGMIVY